MLQNKTSNIKITDEDIKRVEKLFFPDDGTFQDEKNERYNFIKCIDRCLHLQACPGSGKTTALLAKLYLLSEKMPFENNRGICVLTHTNVAIDIIKKRLGEKADNLFQHPNFFGTIQSFVDRFLAIPAYIKMFGYRPQYIDDDFFYSKLLKYKIKLENNYWLKNNKGKYDNVVNFVANINIKFKQLNQNDFDLEFKIKNKNSNTYKCIYDIYKNIIEDGVIRYNDAYALAVLYIKYVAIIKKIFSSRFKYVFIDEAQDTSAIQKEIIEALFDDSVVLQWLGDTNQGIMNDNDTESAWKPEKNNKYYLLGFTNSKRVSQPIADLIKTVAVTPYDNLTVNNEINLKPIIILFDDNTKNKVLEKFAELLITKKCNYEGKEKSIYEIAQETGNPIKAVGWRGKEEENNKLSIRSYYPAFDNQYRNKRKQYYSNLFTMHLVACDEPSATPKIFKDRVINCILEALRLSNIKHTKTSFINLIKDKDENILIEFYTKLAECYKKKDKFNELSNHICNLLDNNLSFNLNDDARNYLCTNEIRDTNNNQEERQNSDIYSITINNVEINFQIATVHSVKGETHTATLYLDTFYRKNAIQYFINEIKGQQCLPQNNDKRKQQALKIAHVAFSRPTHLLCIAIQKNGFSIEKIDDKFIIEDLTGNEN